MKHWAFVFILKYNQRQNNGIISLLYQIKIVTLHRKNKITIKNDSKIVEMCNINKENVGNVCKLTLEGYYNCLSTLAPRTAFIRNVVKMTGVTEPTVVNWTKGAKPQKYEHVLVLSEVTGIKPEDLWEK